MSREKEIYKVTLVGSAGNLVLLTFKFVAGVLGHSSAMIADAVHSLSDFFTDLIVLMFVKVSAKPQDASHDYGHGKYETVSPTEGGAVEGLCRGQLEAVQGRPPRAVVVGNERAEGACGSQPLVEGITWCHVRYP